ncbi:DUF4352 domain-containing protein [Jeotgalibacillus sp. R-1-5s-1]|uniref:DUF4352 domain-containing protein n=1 Tax=Jeotgalibacillus sp. R-1-5s-1 TaxID=2555897 RepID=UPI00106D7F63|nr:DUF4352 domain-containing protein [Jeotgalibacillus sp. R-1-5s-1]TFE01184.1 DUF4352 domain-containing protein [Jeotgalibacillus sp. R-1-5s-1]
MKKFWLVSALAAALMLAACSEETEESAGNADTSEETTEETGAETSQESSEPALYVLEDEVQAGDLTMTAVSAGVTDQIDETNRVYEISFSVTNNGDEEAVITGDQFRLTDLADEEKPAYGDPVEWTVPAGETVEGSLQFEASATTAFKLFGTLGDEEVEWRLPGITSLD